MGWDVAPGSATEATTLLDLDMQGQCTSHLGFSSGSSVILWQSGRGANWDEPCGKVLELEEWVLFIGHAACWIGLECEYWKIWTDFCLGTVSARCRSQAKCFYSKNHMFDKSHMIFIYMSWPRGSPLGPSLPAARLVTHPEFQKDLMEASGEPGQDAVPLPDLGVRYLFGYTPEV